MTPYVLSLSLVLALAHAGAPTDYLKFATKDEAVQNAIVGSGVTIEFMQTSTTSKAICVGSWETTIDAEVECPTVATGSGDDNIVGSTSNDLSAITNTQECFSFESDVSSVFFVLTENYKDEDVLLFDFIFCPLDAVGDFDTPTAETTSNVLVVELVVSDAPTDSKVVGSSAGSPVTVFFTGGNHLDLRNGGDSVALIQATGTNDCFVNTDEEFAQVVDLSTRATPDADDRSHDNDKTSATKVDDVRASFSRTSLWKGGDYNVCYKLADATTSPLTPKFYKIGQTVTILPDPEYIQAQTEENQAKDDLIAKRATDKKKKKKKKKKKNKNKKNKKSKNN